MQVMTDGFKALHVGRLVSFRLGTDEEGAVCALDVRDPNGKKLKNGLLSAADTFRGMRDYNEDRWVLKWTITRRGGFCSGCCPPNCPPYCPHIGRGHSFGDLEAPGAALASSCNETLVCAFFLMSSFEPWPGSHAGCR
jgi:hypothetical protein